MTLKYLFVYFYCINGLFTKSKEQTKVKCREEVQRQHLMYHCVCFEDLLSFGRRGNRCINHRQCMTWCNRQRLLCHHPTNKMRFSKYNLVSMQLTFFEISLIFRSSHLSLCLPVFWPRTTDLIPLFLRYPYIVQHPW